MQKQNSVCNIGQYMSAALRKYGKRNGNVIKVLKNSIINTFCNFCNFCNSAILQFLQISNLFSENV